MKSANAFFLSLSAIGLSIALIAGSAQANFSSAGYPATVTGEQTAAQEFGTKIGTFKCKTGKFVSSGLVETSTALTLNPTYEGCTAAGLGLTVKMNGCDYRLTVEKTTSESTVDLELHIECPAGSAIEASIVGSTCKLKIEPQTVKGLETHNEASDVKMTMSVTGLRYIIENGNKCPNAPASGTYSDGTLNGLITFQGNNGAFKIT
jgi:hypothetical protein